MSQVKLGTVQWEDLIQVGLVSLTTDVSGVLPVANGGTGSGSFTNGQLLIGNTTGNTLTKATLAGTANQVVVTNGTGSITLSLPQDIATGSAVQFGSLKLGTSSFAATSTFESRATSGAQFIASYDASNYLSITTASTGSATYHVIAGSGTPSHIFPDPVFYSKVFAGFSNGDALLSISSTTNSMTSSNTNTLYAQNLDIRLNQAGFTNSAGVGLAATRQVAYINGASGTVNVINGSLLQVGNLGAGTLNTATTISIQGGLNSGGGTLGAWYGIDIADSSAGGTNNIALRSRVTSGSGKYNAYLDGTAQNYIGGSVGIGNSGTLLGKFESRVTSGAQIAAAYDGSNYGTWTVASTGANTFAAIRSGGSADFTFSNTTDSTSSTTGTIVCSGGMVTAKNYLALKGQGWGVTSTATAAGTTTLTSTSTIVQIFTGSTTQTVTLPAANLFGSNVAVIFIIKNRSSGTVTINRAGSDTIDGGTSTTLTGGSNASVTLASDGSSAWVIV